MALPGEYDAGNYNGAIKTLSLNVKAAVLRKAEKGKENAPAASSAAGSGPRRAPTWTRQHSLGAAVGRRWIATPVPALWLDVVAPFGARAPGEL